MPRQAYASWLAVVALGAALAVAGYWLQFTTFMLYDDEGYVLFSLRSFSAHGGLYDQVYSQYGPFFYLLYDAIHRMIGFEFNNVTGRWITLVNWIGTSILCAGIVARTCRSAIAAALTMTLTFAYLWIMINEPMHPGGLIAILIAGGVWLGLELWSAGRMTIFAMAMGVIGSALVLTKINVGVFFIGAVAAWAGVQAATPKAASLATWAIALGSAALPLWLMKSLHDQRWIQVYSLVFAAGTLSTLLAARRVAQPRVDRRACISFITAGIVTATIVCGAVMLRGTTAAEMLNGIVIAPLKHPGVYFFAMNWRGGTALLAVISLAAAAWVTHTGRWREAGVVEAIAWVRLLVILIFLCTPLRIIPTPLAAWGMCYGVALAWLFVAPLRADDPSAAARAWIAFVLTFEFLQGYPIAGSQINWGTFLWVPLAVLGAWDAAPFWQARCRRAEPWASRCGAAAVLLLTVATAGEFARIGWDRYSTSRPLGLPGAESLRLPDEIASDLQIISRNLRVHADVLFSLPGMFSTNIWTGLPTPTRANVTHWFSLLTPAQQQEIVNQLKANPRAAVLVQPPLVEFLIQHQFPITGLLRDWLAKEYHPTLGIGGYVIWLRNGRTIAPVSTGRIGSDPADVSRRSLVLTLESLDREIARIDVCPLVGERRPIYAFTAGNTAVTIKPLLETGADGGETQARRFPFALPTRFAEVTLKPVGPLPAVDWRRSLLLLRDKNGEVIDAVRVLD